jgi:L-lactate dehydrogenase
MTKTGQPEVLSERAAALAWDGRLPGPWLVHQGIDASSPRRVTTAPLR